jgi:hypothetical protein
MNEATPANYKSILDEMKRLDALKKEIRTELITYMDQTNSYTHADDTHEVKLSRRTKVKYDQDGILDMIRSKYALPLEDYTESKLDFEKLEALIANGLVSAEDVADFATIEEQSAITVKEVKK